MKAHSSRGLKAATQRNSPLLETQVQQIDPFRPSVPWTCFKRKLGQPRKFIIRAVGQLDRGKGLPKDLNRNSAQPT